jgi:hypothetical protein
MKTRILQLEPHDDVLSTRDKMGWVKGGRILLVWPERARMLNRRLDLILLQRRSQELGAQLALVTRDPDVHYYAPRLGIPVFKSLRRAQTAHWRVPWRFRKKQDDTTPIPPEGIAPANQPETHIRAELRLTRPEPLYPRLAPTARVAFFTLGVLALLAIAATLVPAAQVTLNPETRSQQINLSVTADPESELVDMAGRVPARLVTVTVEGRDSLPVSGSIQVPGDLASGEVLFTNLTDKAVTIPEGLVVRSPEIGAIRFAVTRAGEVPAGARQTITLPVRSLTPGSDSNLPAGSLSAIEGLLGTQLSVTNPEATRNGTDRREPAPTEADRRQLFERLYDSLQETGLNELQNKLAEGDLLIPASLSLSQTLAEDFQPDELQPADHLDLRLRLEFQAQYISAEDLRSLASQVLDARLESGYSAVDGTLELESLTPPVVGEDGLTHWEVKARRQIEAKLSEPQAVQLALGLDPQQAQKRLAAELRLAKTPEIALTPSWWPRMPVLPFRIVIVRD